MVASEMESELRLAATDKLEAGTVRIRTIGIA